MLRNNLTGQVDFPQPTKMMWPGQQQLDMQGQEYISPFRGVPLTMNSAFLEKFSLEGDHQLKAAAFKNQSSLAMIDKLPFPFLLNSQNGSSERLRHPLYFPSQIQGLAVTPDNAVSMHKESSRIPERISGATSPKRRRISPMSKESSFKTDPTATLGSTLASTFWPQREGFYSGETKRNASMFTQSIYDSEQQNGELLQRGLQKQVVLTSPSMPVAEEQQKEASKSRESV